MLFVLFSLVWAWGTSCSNWSRILQAMVSGIPLVLGLGVRISDPQLFTWSLGSRMLLQMFDPCELQSIFVQTLFSMDMSFDVGIMSL